MSYSRRTVTPVLDATQRLANLSSMLRVAFSENCSQWRSAPLPVEALAEYATALLRGYAALDAEHRPEPPKVEQGHHVRFVCELEGALECRFDEV